MLLNKISASARVPPGTRKLFHIYPAPGYRLANSGALYDVGYRGYSWASTASGTNGMFFSFFTQHLYPSTTGSRSHGLLLRCLSE